MSADRRNDAVTVSIPAGVLEFIFNDCDRYDHDETGGRIIGMFHQSDGGSLEIKVTGVIEAGPRARRTSSSFFQDGDYQAQVFRKIEDLHPDIEHLGNWHTHHVNGFPTLSTGDIETYRQIVNHEKHNHDYFYALLVVERSPSERGLSRYRIRHYILFRGDDSVYEIDSPNVIITQESVHWPLTAESLVTEKGRGNSAAVRANDDAIIAELFPSLRPYWSKRARTFYWKGLLDLVDGSSLDIMVPEMKSTLEHEPSYYQVLIKNVPKAFEGVYEEFGLREFRSATQAVRALEKEMNGALYRSARLGSSES